MPLLRDENLELHRVHLPAEGEWVDVRPTLSVKQRAQLAGRAFAFRSQLRAGGLADGIDVPMGEVYEAMQTVALHIGIVRWSFAEPVTAENIDSLDEESAALIVGECDRLWSPRTDDEQKNSSRSGAPSTRAPRSVAATRSNGTR